MTHNCQRIVNKYLFYFMVMGHCFRFKYNRTSSVLQKFTDETIPECEENGNARTLLF